MPDGSSRIWRLGILPAHDVERLPSGEFRLAAKQFRTGLGLFTDYWLEGAAAALRQGLVEEIAVIGGCEERYPDENVSRPDIIRMLLIERGAPPEQLRAYVSQPHTAGNAETASAVLKERGLWPGAYVLLLTFWHMSRGTRIFRDKNMLPPALCTEELWWADAVDEQEIEERARLLKELYGRPGYAERLVMETCGLAHMTLDTYAPGKC